MYHVAVKTNAEYTPLAFQLDVPWERAKSQCVEKASEDCLLVCNLVAPEKRSSAVRRPHLSAWYGALFGSRSADDGLQKCQDLRA